MQITHLRLQGLILITPQIFYDERGSFYEMYQYSRYAEQKISVSFVQDNLVFSHKGTLRGLHFQSDPGEAKLISCIVGKIWDVAVDIRTDSPTFGQWEAIELDDSHHSQLFIPAGFAHGYCVLSDTALVQYKVSSIYTPEKEQTIRWHDPDLAIAWPVQHPTLSIRDKKSPFFKEIFQ